MLTKEQRMQQRLDGCSATLEVIKLQECLSIFGEHGEYLFLPLSVSRRMKDLLVEELTRVCENLKYHLNDGNEVSNT